MPIGGNFSALISNRMAQNYAYSYEEGRNAGTGTFFMLFLSFFFLRLDVILSNLTGWTTLNAAQEPASFLRNILYHK